MPGSAGAQEITHAQACHGTPAHLDGLSQLRARVSLGTLERKHDGRHKNAEEDEALKPGVLDNLFQPQPQRVVGPQQPQRRGLQVYGLVVRGAWRCGHRGTDGAASAS